LIIRRGIDLKSLAAVFVGMESDEEIGRVPDVGLELAGPSTSGRETAAGAGAGTSSEAQAASAAAARRRVRSPADKEHRRLKRCVVRLSFLALPCLFIPYHGRAERVYLLDLDRLDAYCGFVCVRSLRGSCREAFCLCRRGIEGVPDRRAEAGVNLARSRTTQLDVVQSCLALGRAKDDTNLIDNNMLC